MGNYDVVIVGAGLGSLAAANALVMSGKTVKVVQGECDGECCGCSAGLSPTGMLCLEALGPEIYAAAKQYSTRDLCSSCIYTKDGLEMPPSNSDMRDCICKTQQYGPEDAKGMSICNFHLLRKTMTDNLPEGTVELNMKIKGYQEDADGINLYFEDRQPVRGKLLVGADGALSQIRRQLFPDEKDPSLARVCWQGTATVDAVKGDTQGTKSHMWSDGLRWGGVLRIPGPDGSTMTSWMFVTQTNKDIEHQIERLMASSGPEARQKRLQMALDAMEDFDSDFKRVVRSTEQSKDQVRLACVYQRAPGMVWGKGRVTLLGDAAHLVSPMYGVGRAMCLEDGLALGSSIQRYGARELALRRYECMRIHRVTRVQVAMAGACHGKAFVAEDGKMEERKERMLKFILDYKPEPLLPQGNDLDRATVRDRVSIRGEGDPEKRTEAELSSVSPRCGKRCCHRVDSGYAMQEEATNHNIV